MVGSKISKMVLISFLVSLQLFGVNHRTNANSQHNSLMGPAITLVAGALVFRFLPRAVASSVVDSSQMDANQRLDDGAARHWAQQRRDIAVPTQVKLDRMLTARTGGEAEELAQHDREQISRDWVLRTPGLVIMAVGTLWGILRWNSNKK